MSFQRITIIGSIPRSNSEASASRTMRSPSFSSRLISTVKWRMSPNVRSRGIALLTSRHGLVEDPRQLLRLLHRRLDPVEPEEVGDLLDEVDDVVERRGERVDVLAVDRRDERRVQALDDVVRDPVALLLADRRRRARARRGRASCSSMRSSSSAARTMLRARLLEQVEELALLAARTDWDRPAIGAPV